MFEFLYYAFVLWFLFIEIGYILNVNEKTTKLTKFKELSLLNKDKKWDDRDKEYKSIVKSLIFDPIVVCIVLLGGLFTFQWPVWLGLLLIALFIESPINKFARKIKSTLILNISTWLHSVLGFGVALFVLINKFHLHIDLGKIVENFFQ